MKNLTPNQAAAQALQLFSQEARLCDRHPTKVARTHNKSALACSSDPDTNSDRLDALDSQNDSFVLPSREGCGFDETGGGEAKDNSDTLSETSVKPSKGIEDEKTTVPFLTEQRLKDIVTQCSSSQSYSQLIHMLGEVKK